MARQIDNISHWTDGGLEVAGQIDNINRWTDGGLEVTKTIAGKRQRRTEAVTTQEEECYITLLYDKKSSHVFTFKVSNEHLWKRVLLLQIMSTTSSFFEDRSLNLCTSILLIFFLRKACHLSKLHLVRPASEANHDDMGSSSLQLFIQR